MSIGTSLCGNGTIGLRRGSTAIDGQNGLTQMMLLCSLQFEHSHLPPPPSPPPPIPLGDSNEGLIIIGSVLGTSLSLLLLLLLILAVYYLREQTKRTKVIPQFSQLKEEATESAAYRAFLSPALFRPAQETPFPIKRGEPSKVPVNNFRL